MSDASSYVILNVSGFHYKVKRSLLLQFPKSVFPKVAKSGRKKNSDVAVVDIDRNGELFKYVYDYMFYGRLPRNESGFSVLRDSSLLKDVIDEAKFYRLPGLVAECQELLDTNEIEHRVKHYATVLDDINEAKSYKNRGDCNVIYKSSAPDSLLALLRANPFAPAWVKGTLRKSCNPNIFMSTTVQKVNVAEIVAASKPSSFGRGTKTVRDKKVRDSIEIPASKLCDLTEIIDSINISSLAPHMKLTLKPYKLVVYQEGGHFDSHRDTVRGDCHVGTLVLILNSKYAGGELEVCHGEQNVIVTGALKWVAMYGDCVHTIHPVTSGTRVSLIFDIWNESEAHASASQEASKDKGRAKKDDDDDNSDNDEEKQPYLGQKRSMSQMQGYEEDEEDDKKYGSDFWPQNEMDTGFWRSKGTNIKKPAKVATASTPAVGIAALWTKIFAALDKELETYATVSICLEHLYPACQANPNFLKGEDAKLYAMLKDKYSLAVAAITLARISSEDDGDRFGCCEFGSEHLLDPKTNALFVPRALNENSVLYYLPGLEYTGNEAQDEESVYLVAALVVRKK